MSLSFQNGSQSIPFSAAHSLVEEIYPMGASKDERRRKEGEEPHRATSGPDVAGLVKRQAIQERAGDEREQVG